MSTELIFFIIAAVIANLVLLGVLLVLPRGDGSARADVTARAGALTPSTALREPDAKYASTVPDPARTESVRILRVLWWITIAVVLIGIGLSGAFPADQPLVYALGAGAVLVVVVLHEVLPAAWRRPITYWLEALLALALASGLLVLTGYAQSPFFFTLVIVAVAVALARGGRPAVMAAALAALAYVGIMAIDPDRGAFGGPELLRFGINLGSIWLLAFLAAFFSGQERRARSEMLEMSVTDPLTGLFNRAQLFSQVDQEIRRTRRSDRGFCLLMIDLDGLKAVNDSHGHHRGDEVLAGLGAVIRRSIRTVDAAYRFGGDEFVILLPETDIVGAFVVAEKIRIGAEELANVHLEGSETSVSIGLVSHPEDGMTVDELMIAADRAMYAAKSLGKNQISGYPRSRRAPTPMAALRPAPKPVGPGCEGASATSGATPERVPSPSRAERGRRAATEGFPQGQTEQPPADPPPGRRPASAERSRTVAPRAESSSETDDFDPAEARRRIAALSYDPDHQIRRAMDAFLSAPPPRERREEGH